MKHSLYIALVVLFLYACGSSGKAVKEPYIAYDSLRNRQYVVKEVQPAAATAVRYDDFVYAGNIATILLHKEGNQLAYPIIELNTAETLRLSFDDLDGDYKPYMYTVIHCSSDWKPSDIWPTDYLEGFQDDYIREYRYSSNTLQRYTYYTVTFPNERFRMRVSGNYLLKVYREGEPDKPVFTRRFLVTENAVQVEASVRRSPLTQDNLTYHELPVNVVTTPGFVTDPNRFLTVTLLQNFRWDNAAYNLLPFNVDGNRFDFRFIDGRNTFEAGNSFRWLDLRSMKVFTDRVREIERISDGYVVTLFPDEVRSGRGFVSFSDLRGSMLMENRDYPRAETDSEYAWVRFFVPMAEPLKAGHLYVMGALTAWNLAKPEEFPAGTEKYSGLMVYNYPRQGYEATLYLKQGYYNYLIGYVGPGLSHASTALIEGNYWSTENNYVVLVYLKEPTERFHRLVAARVLEM